MDGIILVNKPAGKTSADIVRIVKKKLNVKKVGHAGTLDPLATGLLIILINKGTKISNYLLTSNKEYQVKLKLFLKTDTGDITGNVLKTNEFKVLEDSVVKKAVNSFDGIEYDQVPPIYSAIKVKGKKLYQYARNNEKVDIVSRKVTIKKISNIIYNSKTGTIIFTVSCTKGTYIRSLVEDIAMALGLYGTMQELKRIKSGLFEVKNSVMIEDISNTNIISIYEALEINKCTIVDYENYKDVVNGKRLLIDNDNKIIFIANKRTILAIYSNNNDGSFSCLRGI